MIKSEINEEVINDTMTTKHGTFQENSVFGAGKNHSIENIGSSDDLDARNIFLA